MRESPRRCHSRMIIFVIFVVVVAFVSVPLFAQDWPVDIITHPIAMPVPPPVVIAPPVDLTPVWNAIQALADRQQTYETRLDVLAAQVTPLVGIEPVYHARMQAIETRVTVLESKPSQPPAVVQVFDSIGRFFLKPAVLAIIGTVVTCKVSKQC